MANLIEDSYIDSVIKASGSPSSKTTGEGLRNLIKLMRDRFEEELGKTNNFLTPHYFRPQNSTSYYQSPELMGASWIMVFKGRPLEVVTPGNATEQDQVAYYPEEGSLTFGSTLNPGDLITIYYRP